MKTMLEYINLAVQYPSLFPTIIVIAIMMVIVMPLVYWMLNKLSNNLTKAVENLGVTMKETFKEHETKDHEALKSIEKSIDNHNSNANKQFNDILMKMGNTALDTEQTVDLLISKMWFVSYGKLEFIKQIMIFNHIQGRRKEITDKVRNELAARSDIYLKDFQKFITPIGDLSDWLNKNFSEKEFNKFVEEIVDIIYDDKLAKETNMSKEAIISLKINDISVMMKTLQARLGNKLREDIKNFNS